MVYQSTVGCISVNISHISSISVNLAMKSNVFRCDGGKCYGSRCDYSMKQATEQWELGT